MASVYDLFPAGTPVRLRTTKEVPILLQGRFAIYSPGKRQYLNEEQVKVETWVDGQLHLNVAAAWLEQRPLPPDAIARLEHMRRHLITDARLAPVFTPYLRAWRELFSLLQELTGETAYKENLEWFWYAGSVKTLCHNFDLETLVPSDLELLKAHWKAFRELHKQVVTLEAEILG